MRIGIISVNNAHNYGTCMQAYAFREYLSSLGHEVQIIDHRIPKIEKSYMLYQRIPKPYLSSKLVWAMHNLRMVCKKPYIIKRRRSHEQFFDHYYNATKRTTTIDELRNAAYDFDVVFAGSDQIWNSEIIGELTPAFFCDFTGPDTIRASYAASVGKDELSEGEREAFRRYLKDMDYISVREENAKTLLGDLTDKEISICLDPTLVADKKIYDKLLKKPEFKGDYIYAHLHHFSGKGEDLVKATEELSKRTGLPVVHNLQQAKFSNELGKTRGMGPEDVLTTIANAKMVITQSFHVTVFSLIYHKNFITLARDKFSDRMKNLLHIVGLDHHYIQYKPGKLPKLEKDVINYDKVQRCLEDYRRESVAYIDKVLKGSKATKQEDYFRSGQKSSCYGCSLCADICPEGAITMTEDEEGYLYPSIDREKCTDCGLCREKCIYNYAVREEGEGKYYLAYQADEAERRKSSSGAVFPVLAAYILDQGGYVAGVRYDENFTATYDLAHTREEMQAFRGAKYVEPWHGDIYSKVKEVLDAGKPVLFTGSACKIAGLKNYLEQEYENLYLMDTICGVTAPYKVFAKYLKAKEWEKQCKVTSVRFHTKEREWEKRAVEILYEDTTREFVPEHRSVYAYDCVNGFLAKPSCFDCAFAGDHHLTDLTMGDFRRDARDAKAKSDGLGYSAVKVETKKGQQLLDTVAAQLQLKEITKEDMYENNRIWHTDYPQQRATAIREILESDVEHTMDVFKQYNPTYKQK